MRIARYLLHRLAFVLPQLLGIVLVSFFLVKSIPGDPAVLMLGPTATPDAIAGLRTQMGLDQPFYVQFILYVNHLLHGDLGTSWQTTRPVLDDLIQRFPATLELVTFSLMLAIAVGMGLGIASALNPKGWVGKLSDIYGLSAGALPDFWFALVLIFVFYTLAHWAPAPLGRLDIEVIAPAQVTGFMTIDTLLAGDMQAFRSAVSHLILPVLTLGLINAGPIMKMTQSSMEKMLASDAGGYEVLCGIPQNLVARHALRNALPSVVTIISVLYGYLIGGAVLVEIVFSWGGAGQYAVQGVLNSDIYPVLGFAKPSDPAVSATSADLLRIEDLLVVFPTATGQARTVLRGIDLSVKPGEVLGLVGESGAGKTTLARSILGVPPAPGRIAGGRVIFEGRNILALPEKQLRLLRGRRLAMVVPNPRGELNPTVKIGDQIATMARVHLGLDRKAARDRAFEMLKAV